MTSRAPRAFGPLLVALTVVLAVLGWVVPTGTQAALVRTASTSVGSVAVGHAPAAAVRAGRSTVVGALARSSHSTGAAGRVLADAAVTGAGAGSGSTPLAPVVAVLGAALLLVGVRGRLLPSVEAGCTRVRSARASQHRDRAPPAASPFTA